MKKAVLVGNVVLDWVAKSSLGCWSALSVQGFLLPLETRLDNNNNNNNDGRKPRKIINQCFLVDVVFSVYLVVVSLVVMRLGKD